MPESQYDPSAALVPETPAGYRDPERFHYPLVVLLALVLVVGSAAVLGFGWLLSAVQGPAVIESVFEIRETPDGFVATLRLGTVGAVFVGTVLVVTVLHELVHGLVYSRLGYRVSYGVAPWLGAFYAAAFHQFQTRADDLLVGVAPLLVLDCLMLPLLFVPVPLVAFAAFVGLAFNTAGAAGDVYLVARLLRMPDGTLLYDGDAHHSYVFYPESGGGPDGNP